MIVLFESNIMKLIDISTPKYPNTFALVDDEDFDWLNQYKWTAVSRRQGGTIYAMRKGVYMHRAILGIYKDYDGVINHRNHNGLDNQKRNYVLCADRSSSKQKISRTYKIKKYQGIIQHKADKKWTVAIRKGGEYIYIGRYHSEDEAAQAYDKKAIELYGEHAATNF